MKHCVIILFCSFLISNPCIAQTSRAFLIGINQYNPLSTSSVSSSGRKLINLEGCVNDIQAVRAVLAARFSFAASNMQTLLDQQATRQAILDGMNNLLNSSQRNDVALIYFSGHGSQVKNSLSAEPDQLDETIVPADAWKSGVQDIRDKELARVFNRFLDKGVKLTVIFDCCHSGSISRGPGMHTAKKRFAEGAADIIRDDAYLTPPQERKDGNFLLLAASQDNESASEQELETGEIEGAFTVALLKAIQQLPYGCSVIDLFAATRAILKSNQHLQEPVMSCTAASGYQSFLFNGRRANAGMRIAVSGIEQGKIMLQGGHLLGLNNGSLLKGKVGTDSVMIRIDSVYGLNLSSARIVSGSINNIKEGYLFELANWVASPDALLKIYMPESKHTYIEIAKLANINRQIIQSGKARIIRNLDEAVPAASIYFYKRSWYVNHEKSRQALPAFTVDAIEQLTEKNKGIYIELPPDAGLSQAVRKAFANNAGIIFTKNQDEAHYVLYGAVDETGQPAYGLRKKDISPGDSLESMPSRSSTMVLTSSNSGEVAAYLYETALKFSKIRGWLQLTPPLKPGDDFPFHLEIFDKATGKKIQPLKYTIGQTVLCKLVADEETNDEKPAARYIYVFVIDKDGNMSLIYPSEHCGDVYQRVPQFTGLDMVKQYDLCELEVTQPSGTDTYYLLATDQPIANPQLALNQTGVRGHSATGDSPLEKLLNMGNEGFSNRGLNTTEHWTLRRLSVKAVY
ncbi:MAG TPA: caspase family protein [Ferruginibacter sp.]|nr:caspase family protein [Ferruginibacter sp.]